MKAAKVGFFSTPSLTPDVTRVGREGEDLADAVRVADGEVDAENAAVAPADDVGLGDVQTVHQRDDVVGHQIVAVGPRVAGAAAVAAAVHQNDGMMRRHGRDLIAPIVGVREAAVQENHRRPLAVDPRSGC